MSPSTRPTTRRRLLRAAGELYARDGIGVTSVRAIIGRADANLNAVHYHFGSKLLLTKELFEEAVAPIRQERHALLADAARRLPSVGTAVEAVYWPVTRRAAFGTRSERRSVSIINQLRFDPSPEARAVLEEHEDTFAPAYEALMMEATGLDEPRLRNLMRFINEAFWGLAGQAVLEDRPRDPVSSDLARRERARFECLIGFVQAAATDLVRRCKEAPEEGKG